MVLNRENKHFEVQKTDEEWKQLLEPPTYHVLRNHGTEPAFRNQYHDCKEPGEYQCAGCGQPLFHSEHKYDSGSGWPSFHSLVHEHHVGIKKDYSMMGIERTEVHCSRCGGHLGHVFPDGPKPTGMRYCINSAALKLNKDSEE
ncbi:peptide-methionine (R)-S-oxide reductase [Desulfuribacillus stibiiarsenatis]|uniref:peptide-methionine (R)-S-oxide reductase n=1 Tax=Desulfuribacillus stibiiarsenatis TaxID=1390249 RepID=A0A1E5L6D4_9FIRM|nr:peptide-methionine (R)-S-oxide reductase MsrB [Desulfuribacillus stibiiarsenatis]OEH85676.1 peptide-methionine (R)-S-oxide reductase [Desulfuribacillus stibiiarsenatis]